MTPAQAQELNRLMGQRAKELAETYRIDGTEKVLAGAIRKAVRLETGVKSTREISRCDYPTVRGMILDWDDFEQIRAIKRALRG